MAKAKKPTVKPTAKSASATKTTKKTIKKTTTSKQPERKSALKPAPKKSAAKTPATDKAAAPAPKAAAPAKTPAPTKATAPAKAAAPKKPAPKKSTGAAPIGVPMIDTNLAAQTAAAMLLNRPALEGGASQPNKESATFKNLKEQLAHPKPTGLGNLFGPAGDSKKSGGQFNAHQERGHNQTFGGMNKTGVPRRTNG